MLHQREGAVLFTQPVGNYLQVVADFYRRRKSFLQVRPVGRVHELRKVAAKEFVRVVAVDPHGLAYI